MTMTICPHCGKTHGFDFASFVSSCSAVVAIEFTTQKVTFGVAPKITSTPVSKVRVTRKVVTQRIVHKVS